MEFVAVARLTVVAAMVSVVASCGDDPDAAPPPPATTPSAVPDSAVATSAAADSTVATLPSTSSPTTTAPTPTVPVPVGLTDWPPPSSAVDRVPDLPKLLPASPIEGADDAVRFEQALDDDPTDYVQVFVADDGSRLLQVTTNIFQLDATPAEFRDPVEVAPWDVAFFRRSAPGFANLTVGGAGGYVDINGWNMTHDEALAAARSMTRRPDARPGWDIDALPVAMTPLHEGWLGGYTVREIDWTSGGELVAELSIWGGNPTAITSPAPFSGPFATVDVAGHRAMVSEQPATGGAPISLVAWSPSPDIVVYVGMRAPLVDALEVARTLQPADLATWTASSRPGPSTDGCRSFIC